MAGRLNRREIRMYQFIWMYHFRAPDSCCPVVVLSRQSVIPLLRTVMVAPITSTIHGVPSEVLVGVEHGLKRASAINLDHIQTMDKTRLRTFIAHLDREFMSEVGRALEVATGCPI